MSTLTKEELCKRLSAEKDQLVVTPMLTAAQVGPSSIDLRLGNQFILFRMHTFPVFDPWHAAGQVRRIQERHVVPFGQSMVLHPGTLALGATFEYVAMPHNLEAQVEGRSSWARVGLIVASATTVEPGFKGVVTLELSNVGNSPLILYPGIRIAQLVVRAAEPPLQEGYGANRKYRHAIGPEFSRLHLDPDLKVFASSSAGHNDALARVEEDVTAGRVGIADQSTEHASQMRSQLSITSRLSASFREITHRVESAIRKVTKRE